MGGAEARSTRGAHEHRVPLGDVLLALAEELERARTLGLRIEGAMCSIAVRSSIDGAVVSELQQLDAVLQHIAALRDFAAELSKQCDRSAVAPIGSSLDRITLGDVRTRLSGGDYSDDPDDVWEML